MKTLLSHLPPSPIVVVTTRPVFFFAARTSSACLGNFCSSLFFCLVFHLLSPPTPPSPVSVSTLLNRGALFTAVVSVSGDVLFQMAEVHRQIQVQLEEMVGIPSSGNGFFFFCRRADLAPQHSSGSLDAAAVLLITPRLPARAAATRVVPRGGGEGGLQGNRLLMKSPQTHITGTNTGG